MKKLLTSIFLFSIAIPNLIAQWSTHSDINESVRAGHSIGYSKDGDGYLFIVSGRNEDEIITPITQRYQLSTDSWINLAPPPTQLLGGAVAILKDTLYTIGGLLTTPGNAIRTVRKYDISSDIWSEGADFPRSIVDAKAVAYQDSLIYVVGGYQHKTYLYNSTFNRWREATSILPSGSRLSWGGFAIYDDKLVYMCGSDNFLSNNYWNTVWVGTIDANDRSIINWEEKTPFPGESRTFFDAHTWRDGIIMTGGSVDNTFGTYSDETYFYNPNTDVWHQLPPKPTAWLTGNSGSVVIDDISKLICASGYQTDYLYGTEIFSQEGSLSIGDTTWNDCGKEGTVFFNDGMINLQLCMIRGGNVNIEVIDMYGRCIRALKERITSAGNYTFALNCTNLPTGMYFCRISHDNVVQVRKILIDN